MNIDLEIFKTLEKEGYLRCQTHPSLDLIIWNYTENTQFEKKWQEETLISRGLITTLEGEIIARAFDKFFNLGESASSVEGAKLETLEEIVIKHGQYNILEKYDGSLGVVFYFAGQWHIATRGSFNSDQAVKAQKILDYFKNFSASESHTHLFEIIYPENRIVIDYAGEEKLVYLGSRDPKTGEYVIDQWCFDNFEVAKDYSQDKEFLERMNIDNETYLKGISRKNAEGFVLVFQDGFRVKVKHEEYKRLHKLMTGLNPKSIWEILSEDGKVEDIIENVPDEFFKWVKSVANKLTNDYKSIEDDCKRDFADIMEQLKEAHIDRKDHRQLKKTFAMLTMMLTAKKDYNGIIFAMYDGFDYSNIIWKMIKPRGDITFKVDEE